MTISHESADTIRIRSTEDLLALIPHQVGRQPRNTSVLFFPVVGSSALCLSMSSPTQDTDPFHLGAELAEVLARVRHCGEVIVTVYSDYALESGADYPTAAAARWEYAVERAGLTLLRTLVVGPRHWWDVAEPERALPVELIRDSAVNAQMIALGSSAEPRELGDDPRWRHRFALRAPGVQRAWKHVATECHGNQATRERPAKPLDASADSGRGDWGVPEPALTTAPGLKPRPAELHPQHPLAAWHHAVRCVQADRQHWVDAILALSDGHLALLIEGVHDNLVRDALLYTWLTGSTTRAVAALAGLRAASTRLEDATVAPDASEEEIAEALCCVVAVAGEWDGPPDWDTLDSAYRVLQVLDGILDMERHSLTGPAEVVARPDQSQGDRELSAAQEAARDQESSAAPAVSLVAALAQLEVYRGRAHTASQLLQRCTERENPTGNEPSVTPARSAATDVAHRLRHQPTPWWCVDRRTAWPGRGAWERDTAAPE